jgi:type IV pilus assembly protein PilF
MIPMMRSVITAAITALLIGLVACTTTTTVNGVVVPDGDVVAQKVEMEPRRRADIRLQLAASYFQNKQNAIALEEAQRAVAADPTYPQAHALLGLIQMELDDLHGAEDSFASARRLAPNDPDIENNYGWMLCQTGHERESIGYFERAAGNRLYRTPAMALRNAGLCLLRIKDKAAAEDFLRRSFQLEPSNALTKIQLARLAYDNRQIDRAVFYYGLLDPERDRSAAMLWLGVRIARANGDLRKQRQLANDLHQRYPNSPEVAALSQGKFDE